MNKLGLSYQDFKLLTKARLSLTVVFSSVISYLLAVDTINWMDLSILFVGGFFMSGASNAFNQVMEVEKDKLMDRTKSRPLPTARISTKKATIWASSLVILGLMLLYYLEPKAAFFAALSLIMYVFLYTPMKSVSPLAVFVGAFPGAIPFMLGWVAATGEFGLETGILFLIQFVWQFPHFWAIAWIVDEDYKKANYVMLPTGHRDKSSAWQILLYTLFMVGVSIIPYFQISGKLGLSLFSTILVLIFGLILTIFALRLYTSLNIQRAKALMIACVIYLPVIQLVYLIDKYIR